MNAALWRRIGIGAAVVVVLLLALWLARHIPKTIAIFVIAAFIAFGVQPIAARLERRMPKPLAISIVFLGLMIVVALFLVIVIPLTISQTRIARFEPAELRYDRPSLGALGGSLARAALPDDHDSGRRTELRQTWRGPDLGRRRGHRCLARCDRAQHRDGLLHRVLGDHSLVFLPSQRHADRRGVCLDVSRNGAARRGSSRPK